ncbi:uncharacterized protein LOC8050995 isoform X2 [Ixodes scapularis]|uniref:uncharacterized protein LOC8050995 isoform X2 n=1 Tax=Ixodes scapularis TaxID=6945 RepID=UPI001C381732|nr:uncharacterized protein LOC8050995 isoform X2 [Ixodes scapularis]
MNLHKGDTAMVLYVTVINLGHDPLSLSIVSRTCCQQVSPTDIDCDSMLMIGGDMGDIYPGDVQNLTVFYPNMYLIDRVGYCELEIGVPDGEKILHKILFNTTVPRSGVGVPPFLNDYYSAGELKRCRTPDLDPTRDCKPVLCDIKYNGLRNFFNETSFRCEPTANCWDTSDDEMVYLAGSNTCRRAGEALTEEDMDFFEKFQEQKEPLRTLHGYPIKVNCHNGRPDPSEGWCVCDPGWKSDPLDHDGFNPDLMVYHMCTVFSETSSSTVAPGGGGSAKGRHTRKMYIAYVPKKRRRMNELPDNAREPVASVLVARSPDEGASVNGDDTLAGAASLIDRFLNDANTATFILPTLIVVVTMLACMVLGVAIFIVLECRKVKRISASLH